MAKIGTFSTSKEKSFLQQVIVKQKVIQNRPTRDTQGARGLRVWITTRIGKNMRSGKKGGKTKSRAKGRNFTYRKDAKTCFLKKDGKVKIGCKSEAKMQRDSNFDGESTGKKMKKLTVKQSSNLKVSKKCICKSVNDLRGKQMLDGFIGVQITDRNEFY